MITKHISRIAALLGTSVAWHLAPAPTAAGAETDYGADIDFALERIEAECGRFFEVKGIDWDAVSREFRDAAAEVKSDQDHLVLLVRLLARLRDGHASVRPLDAGRDVKWPDQPEESGIGMFWCRADGRIYVKNAWGSARQAGVMPGWEIVEVGGVPANDWLDAHIAELSDLISFSTDQQAFFYATHWGLRGETGSDLKVEMRDVRGRRERLDLPFAGSSQVPHGPAFPPEADDDGWGRAGRGDLNWCVMKEGGWGYIHVRRCPGELPEMIDQALAALGDVPGIIMDWRGNSGGGFDHDTLFGRFVPQGNRTRFGKNYQPAGPVQFAGPVVVIVDATVRSSGETGAGMFKEDGRAYMIGESPTAGMSSSKTTIELPSGLFALYVSNFSNKARFNEGRGIEGVGIIPHETIQFDPDDLAAQQDTLILRAAEILDKGIPRGSIPYQPPR